MPTLIAGVVAVVVLYSLLQMFRAANPVVLARVIKLVGGVVALAVAAFTGLRGELAVAIPLGIFGAGLLGWSPIGMAGFNSIGAFFGGGTQRSSGQASRVRSQYLDMSLDHDSGELSGRIVDGPHAGHSLDEFDLEQLTTMIATSRCGQLPSISCSRPRALMGRYMPRAERKICANFWQASPTVGV